jgi:hypothetical protein
MRILEDHQHRIGARQRLQLRNKRCQRSLPALLRGEVERRIASIIRQRQHLSKQCGMLDRSRGLREQSVELVEPRPRRVVVRQSGDTLHLADDRKKCAIDVLWGAEITQSHVRLGSQPFQ